VIRNRHPLQGKQLEVFNTVHRKGILYLVLVLPDGSKSMIPAQWTDYPTDEPKQQVDFSRVREQAGQIGTSVELLHLRRIVDGLIRKLEPSGKAYPCDSKEANHAARISTHASSSARNRPMAKAGKADTKRCDSKTREADRKSDKQRSKPIKGGRK
jgi:hypothetical protein